MASTDAVEVEYPHPSLEPILKDTYGIIVYQEQIMQIASRMAGFCLAKPICCGALCRRRSARCWTSSGRISSRAACSKGHDEAEAHAVYDMIVRFADYGFPRAHAAAYGVLAFQTAYLKAHYPTPSWRPC